jgi:hypothetical protein
VSAEEPVAVDEDTLVIPTSWRRSLHPRHGGAPVGFRLNRNAAAAVKFLLTQHENDIREIFDNQESDAEAAKAGRAYLGRAAGTTPLGAAAVAITVIGLLRYTEEDKARSFADQWIAERGLEFAVRATVELFGLAAGQHRGRRPIRRLGRLDALDASGCESIAVRVRAALAATADEEYRALVEVLREARTGILRQRVVTSFLAPTEPWVADDVAEVALPSSGSRTVETLMLATSVRDGAQLDTLARILSHHLATGAMLYSIADGVGAGALPVLLRWFDTTHLYSDASKRLASAIGVLPGDAAFQALLDRLGRKGAQSAVLDAAARFPRRALRLFAAAAGDGAIAELLSGHATRYPALAAEMLPGLPEPGAGRLRGVPERAAAAAEALPPLLVTPPWTLRRTARTPVVLPGLACTDPPACAWAPGEREAWRTQGWLRDIAAREDVAALPRLLRAGVPADVGAALAPFTSPEIATLMADWLARLKSVRAVALAWLTRHPVAAARALVPPALGRAGTARLQAEQALIVLARAGHRDTVVAAAEGHGSQAVAAIVELLDTDPLERLPARIPTVPGWADPAALPPVLLRNGAGALPAAAAGHVLTMLAMSNYSQPYAGLAVVREVCDPRSLAEFGWSLFTRWQGADMPSKDSWVFDAQAVVGDDETARRLAAVIRQWPGEGSHSRAVAGLDVLAAIGSDVALMHLHGIAGKARYRGLKERADKKIAEVAAGLGLSADQLADRLLPQFGLDADGSLRLDYGPRQFVVGFDEQLKPYVQGADGKRRKDLPKPGAKDDPTLAPAAYQRFAGLKKDVRTVSGDQIRRLEHAMIVQRRWTGADFRRYHVGHPLLWHIVRRLVWVASGADGAAVVGFRVAEDRTFANVEDETVTIAEDASVRVAHPLHLGDAVGAWAEVFADYEILQPFPQLGRETFTLTGEERAASALLRFAGRKSPTGRLLGLERRGWQREGAGDGGWQASIERTFASGLTVVVDLDPGIIIGDPTHHPEQKIKDVRFHGPDENRWRSRPSSGAVEFDPVAVSEVIRDLEEVTG